MMVVGRLPVLKSCICCTRYARCWPAKFGIPCWLTPFVPWQLAQAAARLRPRLGSAPCARADRAKTAPEASVAARMLRVMSAPRGFSFRISSVLPAPRTVKGSPAKKQKPPLAAFFRSIRKDSRFRSHLGHFFFDELERDFVRLDIHRELLAVGELAEEQLVGDRDANPVIDESRHRAGAHERIEAVLGEVFAQRVGEYRIDFFLMQLRLELHQELVHHAQDDVMIERSERYGRVEAVAELR